MKTLEALESYLLNTRQIDALALRQARLLSRSVTGDRDRARMLLLLALAALHRGAPRAPGAFLLQPLSRTVVDQHVDALVKENPASRPGWESAMTDPAATGEVSALVDAAVADPLRFAPVTGPLPERDDAPCAVLIAGSDDGGCLGFSRYWQAAVRLENRLKEVLDARGFPPAVTDERAAAILTAVFGAESILEKGKFHYRQVAAAALALRTRFLIVSGGPGTGKTSVVIQILRTLMRAVDTLESDRIVLCAPTGRAKARLGESVNSGIDALQRRPPSDPAGGARDRALKNLKCMTVHGLLGIRPDGSTRYHRANPFPYQVIVVDEASMVDLHLFAALVEAAGPECRVILLGDMHQLPSVEAGAVLGDLTERFGGLPGYPTLRRETAAWIRAVSRDVPADGDDASLVLAAPGSEGEAGSLADHAVILTHTYRSTPAIVEIAAAINRGDVAGALRSIEAPSSPVALDAGAGMDPVRLWLRARYDDSRLARLRALRDVDAAAGPTARDARDAAFAILDESRILTFAHEGKHGRIAINALADRLLRPRLDPGARSRFFHGQPVVLNANHHDLDLYNGDTGVAVRLNSGAMKVLFRRGETYAAHALDRLTGLEPAYAMTVHKAQGSEFNAVLLVLPEYASPLLTRQIVYTGLTRARKEVRILGSRDLLCRAVATREERPGGVRLG